MKQPYIPSHCDQQGRVSPSLLVIDRLEEEYDEPDRKAEMSAAEAWLLMAIYLLSIVIAVSALCIAVEWLRHWLAQ